MHVATREARSPSRGIVLIVVLGVLALLVLVGVTFVSLSTQAVIGARSFARAQLRPDPAPLMDFALAQLINDTTNPMSAIRGHSLKRDIYGNDARTNGDLAALPDGTRLFLLAARPDPAPAYTGFTQYLTNIPIGGQPGLAGRDFTRWILKLAANPGRDARGRPMMPGVPLVAQTFEVLRDDRSGSDPFSQGTCHLLTPSSPDTSMVIAAR